MIKVIGSTALAKIDGAQRIAITYSTYDDEGRKIADNKRISRLVPSTEEEVLAAINVIDEYAQRIAESDE